jgi:hypothetical protein
LCILIEILDHAVLVHLLVIVDILVIVHCVVFFGFHTCLVIIVNLVVVDVVDIVNLEFLLL